MLSPCRLILANVHYMFSAYHIVGNVSAGYLHHTPSRANSICSQLIEQFAQQLSTIGHQRAGILMYITETGVTKQLQEKRRCSEKLYFTSNDAVGLQTLSKGHPQGFFSLITNVFHVELYCLEEPEMGRV